MLKRVIPGLSTESLNNVQSGRSSDLLHLSSLPILHVSMTSSGNCLLGDLELTATGIVPDFHRIPFSSVESNKNYNCQRNLTRENSKVFEFRNQLK